ncbi:MAG TPA: PAS domain S-box protein, partial [Bacteroidales bacterium]|nr:PAS domain S-box protein [Bacteroidales bacterium]
MPDPEDIRNSPKDADELYRLTLSNISDAVFITDDAGEFTFICPNVHVLFGYTQQEVARLGNISHLLAKDPFDPAELARQGEIANIDCLITDKSGRKHDILLTVKKISIECGTVLYTCHDITERKKAEKELWLEKEKLEKIAASVPGLLCSFHLEPSGKASMPYASPAVNDVYGFKLQEIASDLAPILSRILPEDFEHVTATIAHSAETMTIWKDEFRYQHPEKGQVWIEGYSAPVRDADGSITWHGFVTDITAGKKADEEREKLATLVESSPNFVGLASLDGQVTYINRSGRLLAGVHDVDLSTLNIKDFIPAEAPPFAPLMEILMQKGWWQGEYLLRNLSTLNVIPVDLQAFIIRHPHTRKPIALGTVVHDIS